MKMMKKINVGSGTDVRPKNKGWTNLDIHKKNGADVIFDLKNVYEGKEMPFEDNYFDYVYCSHVLEDFIEPMTLIRELIRICKKGGIIEIKVPFETSNNLTNIYHKSSFTLSKLASLTERNYASNYAEEYNLKIDQLNYYIELGQSRIVNFFKKIIEKSYNMLPYKAVEYTFLKYLFCILNCKVVYKKL